MEFGIVSLDPITVHLPSIAGLTWIYPVLAMLGGYLVVLTVIRLVRGA